MATGLSLAVVWNGTRISVGDERRRNGVAAGVHIDHLVVRNVSRQKHIGTATTHCETGQKEQA